ncbi:MAG: MarR family transcriptional regulator [Neisseria sp.]|uniref:MarR family winged helix-turn-helix transcriptional regulator n=1 Tax=Neisseria sp. TaxID=192066 RepID=UPI0026DC2F62|nr:MarR family transcriptional regulator [Neisseria sp.]MDO4640271.1 MarR family transcriptional regulator [Neisseria sp.]
MNESKKETDALDDIVAQWQKELSEIDAAPMAVFGRLKRCVLLGEHRIESVFEQYGLCRPAFDVLATLRRSGSPYCLTPTALFNSMMITSGTLTTRLQRMEAEGLISRLPNPNDARSMLVQLTDSGKELVEKVVYPHVENEKRILSALSEDQQQQLNEGLTALLKVLETLDKG